MISLTFALCAPDCARETALRKHCRAAGPSFFGARSTAAGRVREYSTWEYEFTLPSLLIPRRFYSAACCHPEWQLKGLRDPHEVFGPAIWRDRMAVQLVHHSQPARSGSDLSRKVLVLYLKRPSGKMVECGGVRALRIQRLEGSRPIGRAAYGISMLDRAFRADASMTSENDPQNEEAVSGDIRRGCKG